MKPRATTWAVPDGGSWNLLVEKGNHQHFLPGEGSSQAVDSDGGTDSTIRGDRAHRQTRFSFCHCPRLLLLLPLLNLSLGHPFSSFLQRPECETNKRHLQQLEKSAKGCSSGTAWRSQQGGLETQPGTTGWEEGSSGGLWRKVSPKGSPFCL